MPTDFQKKVWAEIDKIPYGSTITYKDIAIKIGKPNSALIVMAELTVSWPWSWRQSGRAAAINSRNDANVWSTVNNTRCGPALGNVLI